jgi:hypothetical protein
MAQPMMASPPYTTLTDVADLRVVYHMSIEASQSERVLQAGQEEGQFQ